MFKGERWLRLREAAHLVKHTIGLAALGETRAILRMVGEDEAVRTCGAEGVREWAEIDLENQLLQDGFGERCTPTSCSTNLISRLGSRATARS